MKKTRVLIYLPVPRDKALSPVKKSAFGEVKSYIKRRWEIREAVRTGHLKLSAYHHARTNSSNRGDIAIGMGVERAIQQAFGHDNCEITVVGWDFLNETSVPWINEQFNLFVIGGGGYIFLDSAGHLNHRQNDIKFLEKLTIPVIALGIGLNRLMHEKTWEVGEFDRLPSSTNEYLRRFSAVVGNISVRDLPTQQLFEIAARKSCALTGDPALFLDLMRPEREKSPTGVMLAQSVGINVAAHGWRALVVLEKIMPIFESTYKTLTQEGQNKLVYFLHDDLEYSVAEYLQRRGVKYALLDGMPKELSEGYREVDFVLSQMLHSSILAFGVGTPVINIAYDLKSSAFFDLFNLSEYSIPWNELTLERLNAMIVQLRQRLPAIRAKIITRRNELYSEQELFLSEIVKNMRML